MQNQFKTFRTKETEEFATIADGQIYTSDRPIVVLAETATMEAAEHFYPKSLLQYLDLVDVEYKLTQK